MDFTSGGRIGWGEHDKDVALRYFSFRDIYKHESKVRRMFSENMENWNAQRRTDPLNNVRPPQDLYIFWSSGGSRWKVDTNWVLHNNRDHAIGFIFSTFDVVCPHSSPAWSYYQDSGAFIAAPEISVQPACRSVKGTGQEPDSWLRLPLCLSRGSPSQQ